MVQVHWDKVQARGEAPVGAVAEEEDVWAVLKPQVQMETVFVPVVVIRRHIPSGNHVIRKNAQSVGH